jgi:alkanesulfonate monooxygenase SsuD/methylene tetrahydromethanopterin reductase-like flavin-dependent oxidoreductase (luciferase family)
MERMRRLADEAGRPIPDTGVSAYVCPGRTLEEAMRAINLPATLEEASRLYKPPPSGRWETLDDLEGSVVAGTSDRLVEEVRKFQAEGARHYVFDLRLRFADWEECLQQIGEEVLPELRRGDGTAVQIR